jgi:peptidoglycan hydrolase-like protein with peptidoglycan-binding domain
MLNLRAILASTVVAAFVPAAAAAAGDPSVAALQVALHNQGLYAATVDGVPGPATTDAVLRFQRRVGLVPDGVAGRRTRAALGRLGRPALGQRLLSHGMVGWDVAALQFLLAWHGFPSGSFDGHFGARVEWAVLRFQRWARLLADGAAGPATIAALRAPPPQSPLSFSWPLQAPVGDPFGPRSDRFHPGIDLPAAFRVPVGAARGGTVAYAGPTFGGYGNLVTIAHGHGVRTMYAHLSRIDVHVGQRVEAGARVGLVGSTGLSTGPHLHFEVRLRGAAVDPLPALA